MRLLHVGCGTRDYDNRPQRFRAPGWTEVRLDIDPRVKPDIVGDMVGLCIAADSVDAVWSSHTIEHVYAHEVVKVLHEFHRVLKVGGELCLRTPDLQAAGAYIATGQLDTLLWKSPAGPVRPLDVVYGHRPSVARGALPMAHKTGLSATTLGVHLVRAGFVRIRVARVLPRLELQAVGYKLAEESSAQFTVLKQGDLPLPLEEPGGNTVATNRPTAR